MNLKYYWCFHCKQKFVVMKTKTNTFLPVEINNDEVYDEETIFDYRIHKSHLLNCKERFKDWDKFKIKFERAENIQIDIALSKLLD